MRVPRKPKHRDTFSAAFNSNAGSPVDHRMILFLALKVLNIRTKETGNGYKRQAARAARQQNREEGKGQRSNRTARPFV